MYLSRNVRKCTCTVRHERPAQIQISLRIPAFSSEASLAAAWIAKDAKFLNENNIGSNQNTRADSQTHNRTSMARTALRPWKFVRDMGSSSHSGLIMTSDQEANSDNLGKSFQFTTQ